LKNHVDQFLPKDGRLVRWAKSEFHRQDEDYLLQKPVYWLEIHKTSKSDEKSARHQRGG